MNNILVAGIPFATKIRRIYAFLFFLALIYVTFRAYNLNITHDEAWTLRDFATGSVIEILTCSICDANNHILNSLAIKFLHLILGDSVFVSRLPNVIGYIFYGYFAYRICSQFLSKYWGLLTYVLLLTNPFLMDFFSLARGYGISFGMMMASLYYMLAFYHTKDAQLVKYSYIYAALAVLANLVLLNYLVTIFGIINLLPLLWQMPRLFKKTLLFTVVNSGVLCLLLFVYIKRGLKNKIFYYGGEKGFWEDTVRSVAQHSTYNGVQNIKLLMSATAITLALVVLVSFIRKFEIISQKTVLLLAFFLPILSVIVQHYLLGNLYLLDRAALFLYPLFILLLAVCLNDFIDTIFAKCLGLLFLAFSLWNFFNSANTYKCLMWAFDAHNLEILQHLNSIGERENRKVTFDAIWWNGSAIDFYLKKYDFPYLQYEVKAMFDPARKDKLEYYLFYRGGHERDMNDNAVFEPSVDKIQDKTLILNYRSEAVEVYKLH